ncbi:unnamed protein product [Prorocentrum cordatum]|uniref:Uncharacterized protein n=1 Tax=Prorocentrum cordatum TaxID=2364126 RepID=A0ABN9SMK9_9DINO|nr:unnamed protein product [Polarella glacialis]
MPQRPAAGTRPDWSARPCAGASAEGGRGGGREGGGGRGEEEEKAERHCEESRRRAPTAWLCTGSPLRAASLHTAQGRANGVASTVGHGRVAQAESHCDEARRKAPMFELCTGSSPRAASLHRTTWAGRKRVHTRT